MLIHASEARIQSEKIFKEKLNTAIEEGWDIIVEQINLDISVGRSTSTVRIMIPPRFEKQIIEELSSRLKDVNYPIKYISDENGCDATEFIIDWSNVQYPAQCKEELE